MAVRQNIGVGGLYPTGRSPLVMDLSSPASAITQRMIKREEQRISQEKDYMTQSQQEILKALDFEVVQGLSDQIQLEHLKEVDSLQDKWASKYAESGGKLSINQLAELKKDQRGIEGKLGKMQADVKTFAFAQEQLKNPRARDLWDEQSWINLKEYAQSGKIGSGGAIEILVPREPSFIEYIQGTYKQQLANLEKRISMRMQGVNTEEGRIMATKDNLDAANNMWESLKQQPDIRRRVESIGEDEAKEQFLNAYGFSLQDQKFNAQLFRAGQTKQESEDYYNKKYGWGALPKDQRENMVVANDFLERVSRGDANVLKEILTYNVSGIGFPDDAYYSDQGLVIVSKPKGKDGEQDTKVIPWAPNMHDERQRQVFKKLVFDAVDIFSGKQEPLNIMKYIVPNWEEIKEVNPYTPPPIKAIREALETGESPKNFRKDIAEAIEGFFDDIKVDDKYFGDRVIITEPGKKPVEYAVKTATGRKKLLDWFNSKVQWEERMQGLQPKRGEDTEGLSDAKKQMIDIISSEEFTKPAQLINYIMEKYNVEEDIAAGIIEDAGITISDFE